MELDEAVRAVLASLRSDPAGIFPFYILGLAVPAIARVVTFIGGGIAVAYLVITGRLAMFMSALEGIETDPPDPDADPEGFLLWIESIAEVGQILVTIPSVTILLATIAVTIVALVALTAVVNAGQIAACFAALRQNDAANHGIRGIGQWWLRFIGLYVLEIVLWIGLTIAVIVIVAAAAAASPILGIFVGIFAILTWIAGAVAIRAIFVFAPLSIVVDDASVFGSLAGSIEFIRHNIVQAVSYYAISIGLLVGIASIGSVLATVRAPSVAALVSFLLVAPALDLLKTSFYGDYRMAIKPYRMPQKSVDEQLRLGLRRGWDEMISFVRETPALHAISLGTALVGFAMGWIASEPLVDLFGTSIADRIDQLPFPPIAALEFFGNNWSVALSTAFAGVAFAIPALSILWFNGFVMAIVARLETAPLELIAFVIPHGLLEIPAILIAGALGIHLGTELYRNSSGWRREIALAKAFRRSFWILLGVGMLLAVAGLIEGFVSPYYFRLFL